jgi:hypothetical protein
MPWKPPELKVWRAREPFLGPPRALTLLDRQSAGQRNGLHRCTFAREMLHIRHLNPRAARNPLIRL